MAVMLTLHRSERTRFAPILQRGLVVRVALPRSVLEFLVEDVGLTPEYVRRRITTVFLDGDVVDSLEDASLRQGSTLALSAAMPGLVGATLRRGGPYAAMRAEITRPRQPEPVRPGAVALVRLKLFNLLIDEIGPAVLERGVLLDADGLEAVGHPADAAPSAPEGLVELQVRFR
jgi:hypothetical protein